MVISFMLPWTGDIIHDACFEVITTPLCRIRGKAGSGTNLYCRPLCQYKLLNVSIYFLQLVNEINPSGIIHDG